MIPLSSVDLTLIPEGASILLIGMLALELVAVTTFKNPAGMAMWSMTMVLVTVSGLFGLGLEMVWIGIMFTAVITIVGVAAQVRVS